MPIRTIIINSTDPEGAAAFYERFLGLVRTAGGGPDRVVLDAVTARLVLRRVAGGGASEWVPDDLQRGFRHLGFKVASVDPLVAELKAAGVRFHLEPIEAEGGVRIAFFYDPDGTLLEFVERDLQYHEVYDDALVAAERALGVPDRPRFDHVGVTSGELTRTTAFWQSFGFTDIGRIHQPSDARGFEIDYLKAGDSVLEVFTFTAETREHPSRPGIPGFAYLTLDAPDGGDGGASGGGGHGAVVATDPDGLAYLLGGADV